MRFGWVSDKAKIIKGSKIPPAKKLEGIRLMNELADKVLTLRQKIVRRRLREGH